MAEPVPIRMSDATLLRIIQELSQSSGNVFVTSHAKERMRLRRIAKQHGHSLQTMIKSYAKWIEGADQGRHLAAMNRAFSIPEDA